MNVWVSGGYKMFLIIYVKNQNGREEIIHRIMQLHLMNTPPPHYFIPPFYYHKRIILLFCYECRNNKTSRMIVDV